MVTQRSLFPWQHYASMSGVENIDFFGANLGGCGFPNIMFILNKLLYAPSKAVVFHSLTYLLPLYAFKPLLLNVSFVVPGLCSNW